MRLSTRITLQYRFIAKALTQYTMIFVMSSADASIKVTALPLIYVVYPWHGHCEFLLMQK